MFQIDRFIQQLQRKLNLFTAIRESVKALVLLLAGCIGVALIYVFQGYKVNCLWYLLPFTVAVVFFVLRYISKYCSSRRAAAYADKHFGLSDALVSEMDFSGREGAFHKLRRKQTGSLCASNKLQGIKLNLSRKLLLIAALLLAGTVSLSMLDDSERIRNARAAEAEMEDVSEQLNNELKKKYAEMLKKLKPEEKKKLEKSGLTDALKKLKKQKKLKDALRQYGQLENKIRKFTARMKFAEKQRLLKMMAQKLMKSKMTRQFGQKLNAGKYRDAAKELMRNKLAKADLNNKDGELKRLRLERTLEKMLESAKDAGKMDSEMSKKLQKLLESLKEFDKDIDWDKLEEINGELCEICGDLEDLEDAEKFLLMLGKMRKQCNNAQFACRSKSACMSCNGKGKGIGAGIAGNFDNKNKDPDDKGYMTGLKGQKKGGSSRIKVEQAGSGYGVSRRSERKVKAQFKRRMESFISRDDVPPGMKSGVKEYFTIIHDNTDTDNKNKND